MIIRVFPRRTALTPRDDYAFIGDPPMDRPQARVVYVSVTFTWDIKEGQRLQKAWAQYYDNVFIGGPAFDDSSEDHFHPGEFIKTGVTFTSRGCNNDCSWCLVRKREGKLREREIKEGNIIQDNNLLQCNEIHISKVFEMLRSQKQINLPGGLEAGLINSDFVDQLKSIRLYQLFVACDSRNRVKPLIQAAKHLKELKRDKKRCYVLIGFKDETKADAEARLKEVWDIGFLPFAQLFQPPDKFIEYDHEWKTMQRNWSRPAITKTIMRTPDEL